MSTEDKLRDAEFREWLFGPPKYPEVEENARKAINDYTRAQLAEGQRIHEFVSDLFPPIPVTPEEPCDEFVH